MRLGHNVQSCMCGNYVPICCVLILTGSPVSELDFLAPPYRPPHWSCQPPPVVSNCSRYSTYHMYVCGRGRLEWREKELAGVVKAHSVYQ